ncbi:MAG: TIGR02757 family protein [Flavobacteriaceae bacterium]|nr:TIGR02757 family protein [Flavobacteriaceae bacterium]
MNVDNIKDYLDEKVIQYNNPKFIESDPIQIPHRFSLKEDIEIASFLTATIAWGNRKMIIKNADKMMNLLGNSPYDFIVNHKISDLDKFDNFVHRTFNINDFKYFIQALKNIYTNHNGMENIFINNATQTSLQPAIYEFKKVFFSLEHEKRTEKHVSDPFNGSACKRINMMLRWLVRKDNAGVDFGLWKNISPSKLSCPLDVHSGRIARKLGLLKRKQDDAKALQKLDNSLRQLDPSDPVKYDFALFSISANEEF